MYWKFNSYRSLEKKNYVVISNRKLDFKDRFRKITPQNRR